MADDANRLAADLCADVDQYLQYLDHVRGLSPATLEAYRRDLNSFQAFVRETEPATIGTREIRHFVRVMMDRGMAAGSVNRHLSALRGLFRYRGQTGKDPSNPAAHVRSVKQSKRLPEALFEREMGQLLNFPVDDFGDLRDRVLMELLYSTGARISELCNADVDQLVFRRQAILVHGKGSRDRYVFLGSDALSYLRHYLPRRLALLRRFGKTGEKALIVNQRGRRLTPRGAAFRIAQRFEKSGLTREVGPHGFRHSFATHILNHGADIRVVQELLGHQRLSTTQVYTHVGLDRLKRVYANSHPHAQRTAGERLKGREGETE